MTRAEVKWVKEKMGSDELKRVREEMKSYGMISQGSEIDEMRLNESDMSLYQMR
jgi:hypothetical protein